MPFYYRIKRWRDKSRGATDEGFLCLTSPLDKLTPDDDYLFIINHGLSPPKVESETVYNSFLRYPGDFVTEETGLQQIMEQFYPLWEVLFAAQQEEMRLFLRFFFEPFTDEE